MRELVLDASVVAKWFRSQRETAVEAALRLREEYDAGGLMVVVLLLLLLELLNLAIRHWAASEVGLWVLPATSRACVLPLGNRLLSGRPLDGSWAHGL